MTLEQQEQYKLWASMSRENANNKLVQLREHEIMNKKMNNIKYIQLLKRCNYKLLKITIKGCWVEIG